MRASSALLDMAAALVLTLLPVAPAAQAQSISNTAQASWTEGGVPRSIQSNTVEVAVDPAPVAVETYRPAPGTGTSLPIAPSLCANRPLEIFPGSQNGGADVQAARTGSLRVGETLIVRVAAPLANRDRAAVDELTATLTSPGGDREVLTIYETGPDTGVFTGAIQTRSVPPSLLAGDCFLSTAAGETVTVAIGPDEGSPALATTIVEMIADPFGFVFDSEDGSPVSGARVTLVDAATGQPATVFALDGVTPWPSSVISGQPITDGAGNVYPMQPGEFRFPLAPSGTYRFVIEPPAPYTAPSTVSPEILAGLLRPDGGPFVITDASYGRAFTLDALEPVRVDIPLDRPNVSVIISKSASRARAQPGDAVFYSVIVRNVDQSPKRGVTVIDLPPTSLRLRPDSIRIDGQPAGDLATISPDGRQLRIAFDTIAAGASVRVTYAMTVRADASPGEAVNRVEASDLRGGQAVAEAAVRIERDTIASRMTIIGRVTLGDCAATGDRPGIPGVRIMLEDGSFAVTDADGRYHFEGVVPGTHVVQVQRQTLPEGGRFVDCDRSTRSAGSAISRFVIGQGGSLAVADFAAEIPGWIPPAPQAEPGVDVPADGNLPGEITAQTDREASDIEAAGGDRDWLAAGDGPTEFLFPEVDHNPRAPAVRVVIRHEAGQKIELSANGDPVDALALDGTRTAADGTFAVTVWRGIPLSDQSTRLRAVVRNADGSLAGELEREIAFVSSPWKAEVVPARSNLVADGKSRPVLAVRLTDRRGRPVRSGVSGSVSINEPYESAALLEQLQLNPLSSQGSASPNWTIDGDDGVALIELAPTMVSGPLHLRFNFIDDEISRIQELESWIVPGDLDWTVIGLAEGSVGEKTIADNMERSGRFDSDLGDDARVALYAKGRVLGRFILTLAYDSAKQEDDQRLLGTIDPNAYYTVFADSSQRRFDAASREKLYLRIESSTFYALYGDFVTGFDQTVLGRYQRTATGVKAEGRFDGLHIQGFAAEVASRYRRDEIQGNGLTGPYNLSDRDIIANSERVAIEVRDRLRSEIVIERRELTRFIDYDIDLMSGTISFSEPVLSRDFDLNPQFIVIEYEVGEGLGDASWNAGARADYTFGDDDLRIGVSAITDKGEGPRTDLGAVDLRARIGDTTEIRAEFGASQTAGETAIAWLVEAEHRTGSLDILAYARSLEDDYGTGQQTGAELGRRKLGIDARYAMDDRLSFVASAWYDESLSGPSSRRAVQLGGTYRTGNTEARLAVAHFSDTLADGDKARSTVLEGAVTQRLLENRLELSASTSIALDDAESVDLPARHRLRARYSITEWLRLVGNYEIADGENIEARTFNGGFELSPWQGSRILTTLGQQDIGELGKRAFAAFGLSQSLPVTANLTVDATLDGNRKVGGASVRDVLNPLHPVAGGGHLSQDGALFEDFTAMTVGASWRKDRWAATARGEYRDGAFADRTGFTAGVIRQLGEGIVVGSGLNWTRAKAENGAETEILDGALSAAYRPAASAFAFLGKFEYRSDRVVGAIAGEAGPAGNSALTVTGDAQSQRLIASLSTNWSPQGSDDGKVARRTEIGLFLAGRYNLDDYEDIELSSTTLLAGLDARFGIGNRIELGGSATVRASVSDGATSFSAGPHIGFVPAENALVTVGYNFSGFRDADFSAARETNDGLFASVRLKFDADSFSFLGLGRK